MDLSNDKKTAKAWISRAEKVVLINDFDPVDGEELWVTVIAGGQKPLNWKEHFDPRATQG